MNFFDSFLKINSNGIFICVNKRNESVRLPPVYGFHCQDLVSLEEALQPLEPYIKELSRYVKIAKKNCRFPNDDHLSKDQSASIYIYTMEWGEQTLYRVLNKTLRAENRQALTIWFPYLKLFDSALDLLSNVKESIWRDVPLDIGKNFTKNQIFTWWTVSSCSSSVNVIETFLQNKSNSTLFLIEAVNGKNVSGYTEFGVKANPLKRVDGSHIVHLIEINDEDDRQPLLTPVAIRNIQKRNLNWKRMWREVKSI